MLDIIGAATDLGAPYPGAADAAIVLQQSLLCKQGDQKFQQLNWLNTFYPQLALNHHDPYQATAAMCLELATQLKMLVEGNKKFLVVGGDHSCAIGTWSGAQTACKKQGAIGLIWVDAHLDCHTPKTSKSSNIHGMPLASLFGYGDDCFTKLLHDDVKLLPQHVCVIGIRSFEKEEKELIDSLGVKVFYCEEVEKRGFDKVFSEAQHIVKNNTVAYGVSLDVDAIDPSDAPGVTTPEDNGIAAVDVVNSFTSLFNDEHLLGMEIAEFNPHHDKQKKTENLIFNLIDSATKPLRE